MFLLGGNLTCGLRIGHAMFDFDMSETETSGCFDFYVGSIQRLHEVLRFANTFLAHSFFRFIFHLKNT